MRIQENQVVWITGASSGIGEALVKEFALRKCKLILTSRNEKKLKELVNQLKLNSEDYLILPFDLYNYKNIPSLVKKALQKFSKIDILINNAGQTQRALATETNIETTEKIFALDFFSPVNLTKHLIPYMNSPSQIVVISSVAGKLGTPFRSSYSAAKHALHGYFDSLRLELLKEKKNINVLIVCPGFVKTNISINALKGNGNLYLHKDEAIEKGLLPEEIAIRIIKAIIKDYKEVVIAQPKEKLAILLKKVYPDLLNRILTKAKVT